MRGTSSDADAGRGRSPADARRRAHFERALRETLLATNDPALAEAEREALRALAERRRGRALALEPIVVEMVVALLSAAFRVRVEQSPMCMDMSRTIAGSLWNDPAVRDRIEGLWNRLLEQP